MTKQVGLVYLHDADCKYVAVSFPEGIYLHTLAVNQLCGMWWLSYDQKHTLYNTAFTSSKATFIIAEGCWTLYGATVTATTFICSLCFQRSMSRLTFGHLASVRALRRQKLLGEFTFSRDAFWRMTHNSVFTPACLLKIPQAALQTKRPRCSVYPRARLSTPFQTPFIGSGLGELCKHQHSPEMNIQTADLSAFIRQKDQEELSIVSKTATEPVTITSKFPWGNRPKGINIGKSKSKLTPD